MFRNIKKLLVKPVAGILAVAVLYIILALHGTGCPFRYFFGIPCPGCGMTRAYLALFSMNIPLAFHDHPLFPLVPAIIYLLVAKRGLFGRMKPKAIALTIIAIIFLAVYLLRLFVFKNNIVTVGYPKSLTDLRYGIKFLEGLL